MRRTTLTAGALAAALTAAALAGCSSSDSSGDQDKQTTQGAQATQGGTGSGSTPGTSGAGTPRSTSATSAEPGKPARKANGHLDYTGAATGSADFSGGVGCEIKRGRLIGLTTPDVHTKTPQYPSFIATTSASPTQVALFNTPDKKAYLGRVSQAEGVTAHKSGSVWTVTVQGLKIAEQYGGSGPVLTLNGSFTCTHLT